MQNTTIAAIATAGESALAVAAGRARDLRGRVTQRRADLINRHLDDGAVRAVLRLIRALLETPLRDDTHAFGQRAGAMLGEIAPGGAAHEQRIAVLELPGVAIVGTRGRGDGETGDGSAVSRGPQFGILSLIHI